MKLGRALISVLFLSTLFIGFKGVNQAFNDADSTIELSPEQLIWAKKTISLYQNHYYVSPYLFSDDLISWRDYVYELCEHLIMLVMVFLIWERSRGKDIAYSRWFFALSFLDMMDGAILTHNNPYFYLREFPVTFNVLSIPFYCGICILIHYGNSHRI